MSGPPSTGKQGGGRLGERLVDRGCITEAQLSLALKEQQRTGARLGEIITSLGFATENEITSSLASQAGVEHVDLANISVPPAVLSLLEESFCREHKLLPLAADERRIRVAMANSFDVLTVDAVSQMSGRAVEVMATTEPALLAAIDRVYGTDICKSIECLIEQAVRATEKTDASEIRGVVGEQPVIQLVDAILRDAVRRECTDVHFEPEARIVRTRFRIDGILLPSVTLPKTLQTAVVARIKLLADLDISKTRLPQDGKLSSKIDSRAVDMRVSTLPTVHGENVVLRILDKAKIVLSLEQLGFSERNFHVFSDAIKRPAGIILVTGPTGSGKTTTLYAALKALNTMDMKIATLEDPVEYELPVIRQSQVNVQAGLTFGKGLRSLLRQDPDVILVGEIRDAETIEVALRAAMTGHLVLSTLHTNSALGAIPRMLNMGVEPFMMASTLVAIVAQRLVRRLCRVCREKETEPDPVACRALSITADEMAGLYRAVGCDQCNDTGFRGRRAIAEVLCVTPALSAAIASMANHETLREIAIRDGMAMMNEEGRNLVLNGETSMQEALRHIWDSHQETEEPEEAAA